MNSEYYLNITCPWKELIPKLMKTNSHHSAVTRISMILVISYYRNNIRQVIMNYLNVPVSEVKSFFNSITMMNIYIYV